MPIILDETVAGVLAEAIVTAGRRLATAAPLLRSRRYKEGLELVRWFETYRLTEQTPDLSDFIDGCDPAAIANALHSHSIDALLHELLAVRLTDSPQQEADRVKVSWNITWNRLMPGIDTNELSSRLFDYYDDAICTLVGQLEGSDPELLPQMRAEGYWTRIIAILHAIERHTAALTSQPSPEVDLGFIKQYRRHVVQYHGQLEPPDFQRRRRIPINDIYVPPSILESLTIQPKPDEISLWDFASGIDRTVLLGDPGGGKTTAAHVLMHHYATQSNQRVPFLVTLREFATQDPPERSVVEHIEHTLNVFYQCPAPSGLIARLLLSGNVVVVFDGLDELVDTSRRAEVTAIVEQFALEYPLALVLVTSRLVGYDEARLDDRQFRIFQMGRFNEAQTTEYVRKWFAQETDIDIAQADRMSMSFMQESADVLDLRANPLMLALMCILYRGEGSIPRNRPEVYEQCATLLFRKWDARRRIHVELRARHLVEPALGYLAYWLFTRDQARPAVTERELISETTEFLHERGFESRDEAADAAREFVEFCRGRAWVFSDAGTTATGQALYTFTHRTFLEYFAATRLSAICDTPEDLAKALRPHIARQEWDVVAELSVQMKSTAIDRGAERIYTTLLNERRRRSAQGRSNILEFLGRCLKSVEPPPRIVRELTRSCLDHLLANDPNEAVYYFPVVALLSGCSTCRETVADEITLRLDETISSDDSEIELLGLTLASTPAIALNHGPSTFQEADYKFWSTYQLDKMKQYKDKIIAATQRDQGLMFLALDNDIISTAQVIAARGGLQPLFVRCPLRCFGITYIPWALVCLYYGLHQMGEDRLSEARSFQALADIGSYVLQSPDPPWVDKTSSVAETLMPAGRSQDSDGEYDQLTGLGLAVTYLVFAESSLSPDVLSLRNRRDVQVPAVTGSLRYLWPYIELRFGAGSAKDLRMTGLPIPEEFRELFEKWAMGTVSFTRPISESLHSPSSV